MASGIVHPDVFPEGTAPDSIDWRIWNAPHVIYGPSGEVLSFGAIADGEFLKRDGDEIVGASAGAGDFQSTTIHIDVVDLLAGIQTLYAPAAGELIMGLWIYGTPVNLDSVGNILAGITHRFDDFDNAFIVRYSNAKGWTTHFPPSYVRGTAAGVAIPPSSDPEDGIWPVETPIYAMLDSGGFVVGPWLPNHVYDSTLLSGTLSVVGNDGHLWWESGDGTSGGSSPNFAANHSGSVVDNDITWNDAGAAPTTGTVDLLLMSVQT